MISIKEINYSSITKKILNDWNSVLNNSQGSTIFHTPEWVEVLLKWSMSEGKLLIAYKGKKPLGLYFYYQKNNFLFFKKSTTGIFETPYGGPLIVDGADKFVLDLLINKLLKNLFITKITIIAPPFTDIKPFEKKSFKILQKEAMVLDLKKSDDILFEEMHHMKKRNIKKAIKNKVRIVYENPDKLNEYHKMLCSTYKRLGLKEPKSLDFYLDLFGSLFNLQRIKLSVAYLEDKPIAAAIFLIYNETIIFWQGASYKDYMKYGSNDILHWDIIQFGKSNHFSKYNLLHFHDVKGKELESLKRFKEGFGAVTMPYYLLVKDRKL